MAHKTIRVNRGVRLIDSMDFSFVSCLERTFFSLGRQDAGFFGKHTINSKRELTETS